MVVIYKNLSPRLTDLLLEFEECELYLFGSASRGNENPEDLDLLLIYRDAGSASRFRKKIEEIDHSPAIHLISMTPEEERFYHFLERTEAVQVRPPDSS